MALLWGLIFERIVPDMFDVIGAVVACAGVAVIYYAPRRRRGKINEWTSRNLGSPNN